MEMQKWLTVDEVKGELFLTAWQKVGENIKLVPKRTEWDKANMRS